MTPTTDDILGPAGPLAQAFHGYRPREGQLAMARAVADAIASETDLVCEAPTGTGKSVAYGVPVAKFVAEQRGRAVIVTANIALQEQLVERDLPMLARVLPWRFTFALLKGRSNYVCQYRADAERQRLTLADDPEVRVLLAWADGSETGDRSELDYEPDGRAWAAVSATSEQCIGEACPFAETCFSEQARAAADGADIVVTNYHLLFAHLGVRAKTGLDLVLPEHDVVVLDEAHKAADIAREFLGFRVSHGAMRALGRDAHALGCTRSARELERASDQMFSALGDFARSRGYHVRLRTVPPVESRTLRAALVALKTTLADIANDNRQSAEARAQAGKLAARAETSLGNVERALSCSDPNLVVSIDEDRDTRGVLVARLLEVGDVLAKELFEPRRSVIVTSATLTTGARDFAFIKGELGCADAREIDVPSPFDYGRAALLVVPRGIPDPQSMGYVDAVADAFAGVVEHAEGRTLGLFTSYRSLNAAYDRLEDCPFTVLRQKDAPRSKLVERFREDVSSVLLGAESFWAGVDVPGESLSCVVIDRLPFPHPEDPIIDALSAREPQAWGKYCLPRAIIAFKQGFGRLIRSVDDRGVVVVMDPRIVDKGYGAAFVRSLPSMPKTREIGHIRRFLSDTR